MIARDDKVEVPGIARPLRRWLLLLPWLAFPVVPLVCRRTFFVWHGISTNNTMTFLVLPLLYYLTMLLVSWGARRRARRWDLPLRPLLGRDKARPWVNEGLWGGAFLVCLLVVNALFGSYEQGRFYREWVSLHYEPVSGGDWWVWFAGNGLWYTLLMGVVTPICEELYFRGTLQDLLQGSMSKPLGWLVQAGLFALFHACTGVLRLQLFVMGALLGLWRWWRGSLIVPILMHAGVNGLYCWAMWSHHLPANRARAPSVYQAHMTERLAGYADPNAVNAYPLYLEAAQDLTPPPCEVRMGGWFDDLNEVDMAALKAWVRESNDVLERFRHAASLPACVVPEAESLPVWARDLAQVAFTRAKFRMGRGQFQEGLEDLVMCCRLGTQLRTETPLDVQIAGYAIQGVTCRATASTVQHVAFGEEDLARLRRDVCRLVGDHRPVVDFSVERLVVRDHIVRVFCDEDASGDGRIPRADLESMARLSATVPQLGTADAVRKWALLGRDETAAICEMAFDFLVDIQDVPPAALVEELGEPMEVGVKRWSRLNAFAALTLDGTPRIYALGYRLVSRAQALGIGLAVLQYRAVYGHLPHQLDVLQETGILDCLPQDPFTGTDYEYLPSPDGFTVHGGDTGGPLFTWKDSPVPAVEPP